jgi:hypothetical protein
VIVNYIASWDGSIWSPLGSGMSSGVNALTVYDGNLIGGWEIHCGGKQGLGLSGTLDEELQSG